MSFNLDRLSNLDLNDGSENLISGLKAHAKLAQELFTQVKIPTQKNERWKYTDISYLLNETYRLADKSFAPEKIKELIQARHLDADTVLIAIINGSINLELSINISSNIEIIQIKHAAGHQQEAILQALPEVTQNQSPFSAINKEFLGNGWLINLPKNSIQYLQLLHIAAPAEDNTLVNNFIVLNIAENSELTLLEDYYSESNYHYIHNNYLQVKLQGNSSCRHYKIQNESSRAACFSDFHLQQMHDSRYQLVAFSIGAQLSRDESLIALSEPGAEFSAKVYYQALNTQQQIDHYIDIKHLADSTKSEMFYKGLMDKNGRGVFNGGVFIAPDCKKITAHQANINLLLSQQAEAYSKPELEIYSDDVQCKHSSSTGSLDAEVIFYLRSRGLTESEAINLLLQGYANEVIQFVHLPKLKQLLLEMC